MHVGMLMDTTGMLMDTTGNPFFLLESGEMEFPLDPIAPKGSQ